MQITKQWILYTAKNKGGVEMKAAIYTRVSTFDQANGYSLDMQDKLAVSYCQQNEIEIYGHYSDEITGAKMDRPALQRLIVGAEHHCFNCVIVHKLDRLSRSQKDILHLIEDIFLQNDIDFISLTENFDTRIPLGKAMVGMLAVFAQFERDQIRERMQLGKMGRAIQGKPMTWSKCSCPFGYDYIDGQYQLNEYSRWVRYIFDHFLIGDTINTIANDMTDRKILNKHWYYTTVKWILENPVYIGMIRWRGELYEGLHTPIVSKEAFYETQEILSRVLRKTKNK